jgi:hypothetical protein
MPQTSAARPLRGAAAVLLSLAAHGALLLSLAALPAGAPRRRLSVECTVVEGCTLGLAPLPGPHPRPGLPGGDVRLIDPPDYPVSVLPDHAQPPPPPPRGAAAKGPPAGAAPAAVRPPPPGAGGGSVAGPPTGAGPGGGGGRPALFPTPAGAGRVVYVIDHSVSMGLNGSLRLALRELLDSLSRLPDGTQFQVVLYNHRPDTLYIHHRFDLAVLDAAARADVARAVANLTATGGSDHRSALEQALKFRPDVLYLVTDGAELSAAEVLALTRLNQGRAAIHAVELGRRGRPADSPLRALANSNRGTYRCVEPGE